jgi:hypothetical protein
VLHKLRTAGLPITRLLLLLVGWHVALHTLALLRMLVWCHIVSMPCRTWTSWTLAGWHLACRLLLLLLLWLLLSLWRLLLLPLLLLRRLSWLQRLPAAACTTTLSCLLLLLFAATIACGCRCCALATGCWAQALGPFLTEFGQLRLAAGELYTCCCELRCLPLDLCLRCLVEAGNVCQQDQPLRRELLDLHTKAHAVKQAGSAVSCVQRVVSTACKKEQLPTRCSLLGQAQSSGPYLFIPNSQLLLEILDVSLLV